MKNKQIEWSSKQVDISLIDPTPDNYKIENALGLKMFHVSLQKFGMAGNVIVNPKGKRYILIDGNSRIKKAKADGKKKVWVSVPSRPLSAREYHEMSAMFDYAAASQVDETRITSDLGKYKDFHKQWGLEVPFHLLDKLGRKADTATIAKLKYPDEPDAASVGSNTVMVNLFFTAKQEAEFRKYEEKAAKKFKTANTTDTVLAVMRKLLK